MLDNGCKPPSWRHSLLTFGTILLFIYALGLGIPLLLLSLYFDRIKNKKFWLILQGKIITISLFGKKYYLHSMYIISGVVLIILGILIYFDFMYTLNQYALQNSFFQKIIIMGEEFLKKLFIR